MTILRVLLQPVCFLFIRSNLYSCPPENVKSQAYVTLVRPCLEYAWSVWEPHTQKHCQDVEGVQRQARQICKKKKCYEREPGTVKNLLCPVVRTPASANPGLNFNLSFFFFLSKTLSPDNFLFSFKSIQSSNCTQRQLNWICFLSSHIWVQISHKPWVILTQLRTTRPGTIWTGIHQNWDAKLHDLPPCTK